MDPGNPVGTTRSAFGQALTAVYKAIAAFGQAVATVYEAIPAVGQADATVGWAVTTELAAVSAPTPAGLSKPPAQQPADT
jgi:hypothetical protein